MILRSPLSLPPNPLAGPRRIGKAGAENTHYVEFDPANAAYTLAGDARDTVRVSVVGRLFELGGAVEAAIGTNLAASLVDVSEDGGFMTHGLAVPEHLDVADLIEVRALIRNANSQPAGGNLKLRASWMVGRGGTAAAVEDSATNVLAGPAAAHGLMVATFGTIPAGTLAAGDVVAFMLERLSTAAEDTYDQAILIAVVALLEGKRRSL